MKKMKVLILEQEYTVATHIDTVLQKAGYEMVGIIDNGEKALEVAANQMPDLILMALDLKGKMDGIETAKIINQINNIPVIFLTTKFDKVSFKKSMEAMPYAFLTKPFDEEDLLRNLDLITHRLAYENSQVAGKDSSNTVNKKVNIGSMKNGSSIFVKDKNRKVRLMIEDILFIEAERNYCKLTTKSKKFLLTVPMKTFLERVSVDFLIRTHRSFVANISQIDSFDDNYLFFGVDRVPLSRSHRGQVISKLNVV